MASNQSVLEQMLQAALSGGGLREKEGGAAAGPRPVAPATSATFWEACLAPRRGGSGAAASRPAPGGAGGLGDILGSILGGQATAGDDAGGVEA